MFPELRKHEENIQPAWLFWDTCPFPPLSAKCHKKHKSRVPTHISNIQQNEKRESRGPAIWIWRGVLASEDHTLLIHSMHLIDRTVDEGMAEHLPGFPNGNF